MAANSETYKRLVETAERLFAAEGIATVSMRRINQDAGQKNTSALHYHFGSKEALIEAIVGYRMSRVNTRRLEMLRRIEDSGEEIDLHKIVCAIVFPLAELLDDETGDNRYIQFLAQAYSDPVIRKTHLGPGRYDEGYKRCFDHIIALRKDVPSAILRQRLLIVTGALVHILSDFDKRRRDGRRVRPQHEVAAFVSNLVDFFLGAISAPSSADTAEAFRELGRTHA
ncbi:TetR/AcrR family transcriptional regulator [Pikeienuella piscinae]|uniref:TetR/AcrR family transcriptional regulator n=1 Tax=Pikeienuella piscinae TaxID=2748098 RepID=A0A7L5BYS3_9RHOB|nr:TetR/AcrR family transcriptional regulator [Pikeienuella piscinae]QIE56611.1 TetR/AcrR family transcriptional regulator [Pikeienuella piscinae]